MVGWYTCPRCGKKLQRLTPESVVLDTPIYCTRCKIEHYPLIWHGKVYKEAPGAAKIK